MLTAHPTEVQRKSILDAEREIARLLVWRDRVALTPEESARIRCGALPAGPRAVADGDDPSVKLQVKDEIDNGLAYYRYTFLDQIPRLYADLDARLTRDFGIDGARSLRSCAPARGSAAIETAIRLSTPIRSSTRFARSRRWRSSITWAKCTGSAPNCRCHRG